jgi:asparagine synthase (glutamine-hydrolysing)
MCGIIGRNKATRDTLEAGLSLFSYRGPDARGFAVEPEFSMGHTRLSIIDLDTRSNQPFWDDEHTKAIVFNGEIYNYRSLRDELTQTKGIRFHTESDTEVLLAAYGAWGREMLPRLRGMFAFAIYDTRAGTVFLARDHAGIKPLYYTTANMFAFASEIKGVTALMRDAAAPVVLNENGLELYRIFGYVPTPHTLVQGIQKLPRGSWLSYNLHSNVSETGVWEPSVHSAQSPAELTELVRASILEHTVSDVPVGLFFSGGMDSSVIALVLQEAGIQLEAFSVAVEGRGDDEPYFTRIAAELGVSAHVARFGTKEASAMYDMVFSRMDDPIADSSVLPTAFVSQYARKSVTVVLSGEGGDELFQGYPRQEAIAQMTRPCARASLDTLLRAPAVPGKRRALLALAEKLGDPVFFYLLSTSLAQDQLDMSAWSRARALLTQTNPLWLDRDWYLENMLLRKADMATMYSSLEGRVPLLGAQVWGSAPRFVRENLQDGTKMILRAMLKKRLPTELVDRPKSGFGFSTVRFFAEVPAARADLEYALSALEEHGFPARAQAGFLMNRYPAYAFGILALYRSLKNIGLI